MRQRKKIVPILFLILLLFISPKINAKTCCTRHVGVDISGSAMEASLARALWVSLFSGECPALIVLPFVCIDYQFKGVLFSGPAGRLEMMLIDCHHNTVVKVESITWPCVSFPNSCIDITMNFIASFAAYFQPLDKIIFDYERIPDHCDIEIEQEELFPGQEIQVKISNIVDFEGRKSREFNRIVVQAVKGEIVGGTAIVSDPELKAFQVGKEDITFTYIAPDEENSQDTEDKIIVYNSCDIRKDVALTGLKDKIAEKKMELVHYEGYVIMTYTIDYDHKDGMSHYEGHYHEDATVRYNLGKELQSLPIGEHLLGIWYPVKSGNIIKANAKDVDNQRPPRTRIKTGNSFHLPDWSEFARNYNIIMVLDTKTGRFVRGGPLSLQVDFTWSDGNEYCIDGYDQEGLAKGEGGVHGLTGSCSGYPGWTFNWTIHMRKRH